MSDARQRPPIGFTFSETMGGTVVVGADDYRPEARDTPTGEAVRFHVRVTIDDLNAFVRDPAHPAILTGTVIGNRFGGVRPIDEGTFNLFTRDTQGRMTMRYALLFRDAAGRRYRLDGFKAIYNDHIVDLWADTTTLFTTVRRADEAGESVLARGILRIRALDLVPQVASMRAIAARGSGERLGTVARFGAFFAGRLWHEYARAPRTSLHDEGAGGGR